MSNQTATAPLSRAVARSQKTLRTMLVEHQHEGKQPYVSAVATLLTNLLANDAPNEVWALFHQVATLPLSLHQLKPQCMVTGYYGRGGVWHEGPCGNAPHCGHRNVQVTETVRLTPPEARNMKRGIHAWWGRQLDNALHGAL